MKRFIALAALIALVFASADVWAASSMVPRKVMETPNSLVIAIDCVAVAAGTFTDFVLTDEHIGYRYWEMEYRITDAWLVNSATDDHGLAAVVTITDATGRVLIGLGDGEDDTLTSLTSASGIARLVINRVSSQRKITSKITIGISDTGAAATVKTLYLQLDR